MINLRARLGTAAFLLGLARVGVCRAQSTDSARIAPAAAAYLDSALRIMQTNFLHRDRIDWDNLKRQTFAQAAGAQTSVDTYPAIRFALAMLGDHHSYLQPTPALTREEASRQPRLANPGAMPVAPTRKPTFPFPSPFRTRRVPEGGMVADSPRPLAQVVIPLFGSQDRKDLDDFATKTQAIIARLAANNPCGWIVDLRGNGGGNIWPMLAGVGPIIGEGVVGGRVNAHGVRTSSFYAKGGAGEREGAHESVYAAVTAAPVVLRGTPPVGVLIDRETGSSGEGIAIDFRGRPETRFFGEATYGASTSTFPFSLSDGTQIYLVIGVMIDRAGNQIESGVEPDEEILSEATISTNDPVIRRAAEWLVSRPACSSR